MRNAAAKAVWPLCEPPPAAVSSIAGKIGCTAQTLNEWVKRFERDSGVRAGVPSEVAERLKALERENRDLRQVNERHWSR